MSFRAIRPDEFEWITRPHEPGEPARHVAELSDAIGSMHVRGNVWRYGYPPEDTTAEQQWVAIRRAPERQRRGRSTRCRSLRGGPR